MRLLFRDVGWRFSSHIVTSVWDLGPYKIEILIKFTSVIVGVEISAARAGDHRYYKIYEYSKRYNPLPTPDDPDIDPEVYLPWEEFAKERAVMILDGD